MAAVKFASTCRTCGVGIPVGTGDVRKVHGEWVTRCSAHKPIATSGADPEGPVRMSDGYTVRLIQPDNVADALSDGWGYV